MEYTYSNMIGSLAIVDGFEGSVAHYSLSALLWTLVVRSIQYASENGNSVIRVLIVVVTVINYIFRETLPYSPGSCLLGAVGSAILRQQSGRVDRRLDSGG